MIYIKPYKLYEGLSSQKSLISVCDDLLGYTDIWKRFKDQIDPSIQLIIDLKGKRTAEAHFDILSSTPNSVVIQMPNYPTTERDKGSLAHELVHAIQWLTNTEGDLMFITDATRDLRGFSKTAIWERSMFAIYLSCPQETEAWQVGNLYHRHSILNEMIPWMRDFDPISASEELINNPPLENQWEMESFEQLPSFWVEAYENYDEIKKGSDIPGLGNLSLEEFLSHYDEKFKKAYNILKL